MVSLTLLFQSSCGLDIETTCRYLLNCPPKISFLLNTVSRINKDISAFCDATAVKLLLCGDESLDLVTNTLILNASADFILASERFDGLFCSFPENKKI